MGKLWRKKHNMDYEVDENDAHLVTVGDKKLFSRYNCAYFLNTGKIRNIKKNYDDFDDDSNIRIIGLDEYEGEDIKHNNNPPNGKEWKQLNGHVLKIVIIL